MKVNNIINLKKQKDMYYLKMWNRQIRISNVTTLIGAKRYYRKLRNEMHPSNVGGLKSEIYYIDSNCIKVFSM